MNVPLGVPHGVLFPTTSIPVAVLLFDRSREKGGAREDARDVLFIDASSEFISGKNNNTLSDEHFEKIIATVEARQSVEKYAYVASFEELAENLLASGQAAQARPYFAQAHALLSADTSPDRADDTRLARLLALSK